MGKYDELVGRLRYIATILLANQHKFAVPDHIPAKAAAVRKAATAITTLEAELAAMKARGDRLAGAGGDLIAVFDEIRGITNAERIVTGRSDRNLREEGNLTIEQLRQALTEWRDQ